MKDKALAIIMAAGLGTRIPSKNVPKVMLRSRDGGQYIDDVLTFLKYESYTLSFAVLSRNNEFFNHSLNNYLLNKRGFQKNQLLYQTTAPRTHGLAFLVEYLKSACFYPFSSENRRFCEKINQDSTIILMPGDHKLTSDDLNLDDLLSNFETKRSDLTIVYSEITNREELDKGTAKEDLILLGEDNGIQGIRRIKDGSYKKHNSEVNVTSLGIFAIRRKFLYRLPTLIPGLISWYKQNTLNFENTGINVHAYFIKENWQGGRDTPRDV